VPTYSLATLQGLLQDQLDANNATFPVAQQTLIINESVRKMNNALAFAEALVPMLTQANQLVYTQPTGILIPIKIYVEGVELEKYSLRHIGTKFRNWATDTTSGYGTIARWAPIGIGTFVIHPQDANGGRLMEVQGVAPIVPLVLSGDVVDLEDSMVPTLIDYARARIMIKLGGAVFAQASKVYQKYIAEIRDDVAWQGMVFPRYYIGKETEPAEAKGEAS
jgi:hypothetical protein